MFCKLCHYVNKASIKWIYYAIFHYHLSCVCTAWGQNLNPKNCINLIQKKAVRIISFVQYDAHILSVFAKLNVIKFSDLISLCNCLFIYKHFLSKAHSVFSHVAILTSNTHKQNTRVASHGLLIKPTCNTSKYGTNAFVASAIASWNFPKKSFPVTIWDRYPILNSKCWLRITFSIPTTKFLFKNIGGSFVSDYFIKLRKSRRFYF